MFINNTSIKGAIVLLCAVGTVACTSTPAVVETHRTIEADLPHRSYVHSIESFAYLGGDYSGAAINQAGTVHTLSDKRASYVEPIITPSQEVLDALAEREAAQADALIAASEYPKSEGHQQTQDASGKIPMSMYDYQNWERYCNNGEGLGRKQIKRLASIAFKELPAELRDGCLPPNA